MSESEALDKLLQVVQELIVLGGAWFAVSVMDLPWGAIFGAWGLMFCWHGWRFLRAFR